MQYCIKEICLRMVIKVNISLITVGNSDVMRSSVVRNLSVLIDDKLSMYSHINKICKTLFYYLHNIKPKKKTFIVQLHHLTYHLPETIRMKISLLMASEFPSGKNGKNGSWTINHVPTGRWFAIYHRFCLHMTLENKRTAQIFPKFLSVLRVINRLDRNPSITATSVTFCPSLHHTSRLWLVDFDPTCW